MNKSYMFNVVPRLSNKVVEVVPSMPSMGPAGSYSGLDGIVEDEPPAAATGRVNAFFEACSKIKVAEGKGDPGKVGPNKKQRAGIKRKEREDKMIKLGRMEEIEQEKFIKKKAEQYANRLRVGLAKRAVSRAVLLEAELLKKKEEMAGREVATLQLLRADTLRKEKEKELLRSDTLHKEKEEENTLHKEESKKRRKLLKQKVHEKVKSLVEKRKARTVKEKGKQKKAKIHWRIDTRDKLNDMVDVVEVTQWMGAQVILRNLKSKVDLNGTRCVVTGSNDAGDRYLVTTDKGLKLSVMADKLQLADVVEVMNIIRPESEVIKGSAVEKRDRVESPGKHYEAKAVAAEIERAAGPISKDVWTSPGKSGKQGKDSVGAESEVSRGKGSYGMRPLKLEALSVFTRNSGISPMVWYERGRRAIRSLAIFEQEFSEQQAIAAIMDRAEAGTEVERWFGSLDSEVWSNGDRFDRAFRKRFDSSRTVDSALEKLLVIRSSGFSSIDMFYGEFSDLVATVGTQRSHQDLVRNFLDAIPPEVRILVVLRKESAREIYQTPLDEIFELTKEVIFIVKGRPSLVATVSEGEQVLAVQPGCLRCKSKAHVVKFCTMKDERVCYRCQEVGHLAFNCVKGDTRKCFNCGASGHEARQCGVVQRPFDQRRPMLSDTSRSIRAVSSIEEGKAAIFKVSVSEILTNVSADRRDSLGGLGLDQLVESSSEINRQVASGTLKRGQISERVTLSWINERGTTMWKSLVGLVDSGAEISCVNESVVQGIRSSKKCKPIVTASGPIVADMLSEMCVTLRQFVLKVELVILPLGSVEMIIGMDILSAVGAVISCNPPMLRLDHRQIGKDGTGEGMQGSVGVMSVSTGDVDQLVSWSRHESEGPECEDTPPLWEQCESDIPESTFDAAVERAVKHIVNVTDRNSAVKLLRDYKDIFRENVNTFRPMKGPPLEINTIHERPVGRRSSSSLSTEQMLFLDKEIPKLESLGVIQKSSSLYNNPPVIVPKPMSADGKKKFRLCHDFRQLNEVTVAVESYIPRVDEVLYSTGGSKCLSKMDLTAGFFQMLIAEKDRHKTAFTTHLGTFEYVVSALGMRNVPAVFNFAVSNCFTDLRHLVRSFFDDFISHSKGVTWDDAVKQHLVDIGLIFERCREKHLVLNLSKSDFFQREIAALGFRLSENKLLLPLSITGSLEKLQVPTSVKEVQAFLGWAGYYRRFIQNFAGIAAPLTALTGARVPFVWSVACQDAFVSLRNSLSSNPVLHVPFKPDHPEYQPLIVYTDASDSGLGAVLAQTVSRDGVVVEHACAYLSRLLNPAERNYATGDRELLAVVWAVEKWRFLLLEHHFFIVTDHMALKYLMTQKHLSGRLARQAIRLQGYNFTIKHRPGAEHANADGLSRLRFTPEDAPVFIAAIMGHELEKMSDRVITEGWVDVAPEVLPVNRPIQALRDTGISVLEFTRAQLAVKDAGLPGKRLDKLGAVGSGVASSVLAVTRSGEISRGGGAVQGKRAAGSSERVAGGGLSVGRSERSVGGSSERVAGGGLSVGRSERSVGEILEPARGAVPVQLGPAVVEASASTSLVEASASTSSPLKYHEEIWLSGAINVLRGEPITGVADKWARKLREQALKYTVTFGEGGCPLAIYSVPIVGSLFHGKPMEVPSPARRVILVAKSHELGHFGADKTAQRLRDLGFDWLGLEQDCKAIISACRPCARDNSHRVLWAPALSLAVPKRVFERVHMDLLLLPLVERGSSGCDTPFQYLLLFVCALSKYPIAFCLTSKESIVIARALWSVICMFGSPVVLNSDNGLEFCNRAVSGLSNLHGISRRLTSAYRPQSNGAVERLNRSIIAVLRKLTSNSPQQWYEWIDFVLMSIRTAVHRSSGYSPFQLMFGRVFNPLTDYHQVALDFEAIDSVPQGLEVVESALVERSRQLRSHLGWVEGAHINGVVQAAKMRSQADASHSVVLARIKVGSLVWRVNTTPSSKLDSRLLGPYKVADRDGEVAEVSANYHLETLAGSTIFRTVPRDQLVVLVPAVWLSKRQKKLYGASELAAVGERFNNGEPGPIDIVDGVERFAIEHILKERVVKSRREVLVKWGGYSVPTWILESDVPVEIRRKLWESGKKAHLHGQYQ